MRVRTVGLRTLAAFALVSIGLIGPQTAAAVDLGTFDLGDLIQMPKDCAGAGFADLHIANGHNPAWVLGIDPEITRFPIDASSTSYVYDTTAQGGGDFTVIIHCWFGDPHDPWSDEFIYTFTVNAPVAATTTTAVMPTTGAKSTTSISLIATFAVLAGAGLLLVRRRSLG